MALVVYDVNDRSSFEDAKRWVRRLRKNCENKNLAICVVGNKIDLVGKRGGGDDIFCVADRSSVVSTNELRQLYQLKAGYRPDLIAETYSDHIPSIVDIFETLAEIMADKESWISE
ncbi:Ras-related protein Rab-21 [Smittium culicis]|uniref:Ras-related protein Rab-21 n=1 Tax=Smittium culicis TaxID=133412 RepID=A0A1R1Y2E0_9FUNG|nr:Ras-related protein Rab-21 [Smittium culicis]